MSKGKLHLIPVPLSGAGISQMSGSAIGTARSCRFFLAERAKTARQFIKGISHPLPLLQIEVQDWEANTIAEHWKWLQMLLDQGEDVCLVSEAGAPCVADPGHEMVIKAHQGGYTVVPHAGPNSMIMALMSSGLVGQQFCFHGYLPAKKEFLREALIKIGQQALKTNATQLFMETPYRNKQMFEIALSVLQQDLYLCVASNLGAPNELIQTKTIKDWKSVNVAIYQDAPAIFVLGQGPIV